MPTVRSQKKKRPTIAYPVSRVASHDVRLTYYVTRDMSDALRKRRGAKKISSYLAERERLLQEADLH